MHQVSLLFPRISSTTLRAVCLVGFLSVCLSSCSGCEEDGVEQEEQANKAAVEATEEEPIQPLPQEVKVDRKKMVLGRELFHDPILSADGTVACSSCHSLDHGGAEARKTSLGIGQQAGPINSPTVLNSALNFVQFWDGRAKDLKEQAAGPVSNPIEMGADWNKVVDRVKANDHYREQFEAIYEDGVSKANITHVLAEYETYLNTPSRFDEYLRGDEDALTQQEREGYALFKSVGCTACHLGQNIGGSMYQKMGLVKDYFSVRGDELTEADMGRFNVTKKEEDKHFFKVPTLRNVELTAPYFHDGSQETLEGAVRVMARHQLGQELTDEQVQKLVAFLKSLTGELPEDARPPS